MKLIFTLATLLSSAAFAAPNSAVIKSTLEAQKECGSFVRFDAANVYLGFARYKNGAEEPRDAIPAVLRVAPLNGSAPFDLRTHDGAIDLVTDGNTAYVLTYTSIEEWNIESQTLTAQYPTTEQSAPLEYKQHASAMARYKNKLIIAHGRFGVSIFDLVTKKLTNHLNLVAKQAPLESMATGIAVQGHLAYVTMDNFSLLPPGEQNKVFKGLVVIDLDTETVQSEMGGMDPGATSVTADASKVIVSFGGQPLWKFGLTDLGTGGALPAPLLRVFKFPIKGHPTGTAAMDDTSYYTCFMTPPPSGSGLSLRVPIALDRSALKLN